tara:strand:- start:1154 stop:1303 length:150 start_codon:yes stop_codon:yes gene_type:complete
MIIFNIAEWIVQFFILGIACFMWMLAIFLGMVLISTLNMGIEKITNKRI